MKSILPKIKKLLKDTKGASLMEFAVVTGLMAVLASTAAPKFSTISESGRHRKSITEMEKIGTQALNFFQDMAVKEGRGRFPGQTKYNQKVGGHTSMEDIERDILGMEAVEDANGNITTPAQDPTFQRFDGPDGSHWVSVFGDDSEYPLSEGATLNSNHPNGENVWYTLFGDERLNSPYQDGHFVYQVIAGSGSGSQAIAPILFIADIENPSQLHLIIQP